MDRMDSQFMLKCSARDRKTIKNLSDRLGISQSGVARVALAAGLKIVLERGIRVVDDNIQESRGAE